MFKFAIIMSLVHDQKPSQIILLLYLVRRIMVAGPDITRQFMSYTTVMTANVPQFNGWCVLHGRM